MNLFKFNNKKILYISLILIFISGFLFGIYLLKNNESNKFAKTIKDQVPQVVKNFLKKTLFYIPIQKRELVKKDNALKKLNQENKKLTLELYKYKNLYSTGEMSFLDISTGLNEYSTKSYILPFYDIKDLYGNKKSGYLDIFEDFIFIVFGSGKIIYIDTNQLMNNKFNFSNLKNNLRENDFFDQEIEWTGIKDIKIINDEIYLSLTHKIKSECYNTAIYKAKINFELLNFKPVFVPEDCSNIRLKINSFRYFNGYQTGGRIVKKNENIFFSNGDYNNWEKVQDDLSTIGKIIKINIEDNKPTILTSGHRNPQGLYALEDRDLIISTEHGPKGGDEINLIDLSNNYISNYGWPISSYGEHYDVVPINDYTKKYAPLFKNHKDHGFIEPIKYFDKALGISEIIKNYYEENTYFVTTLKSNKIYSIKFSEDFSSNEIIEEINLNERIRDIIFDKKLNQYFIYIESSPSIMILSKKKK